jgi:hypothetical protein
VELRWRSRHAQQRVRFQILSELNGKGYENSSGQLAGKFPYSLSLRYDNQGWSAGAGVMRQGLVNDSGFLPNLARRFNTRCRTQKRGAI